jgi:hypothetical protein
MTFWIFIGVLAAVIVISQIHGDRLCRESDYDCYLQAERFRREDGLAPIPWRGSMKRYLKDESDSILKENT